MLSYRTATEADIAFILDLIVENSLVETGDDPRDAADPCYRGALERIDGDPNQDMIIVEDSGERVGCFQLTYIPGFMRRGMWRGQIENVHVQTASQNRGIGSAMMKWAIERCRERGCGMIQLTSNKKRLDAHRFYERLGFSKSHEGFKFYL